MYAPVCEKLRGNDGVVQVKQVGLSEKAKEGAGSAANVGHVV